MMSYFEKKSCVLITCPRGATSLLAAELVTLGFEPKAELAAGVEISATLADCMKLNLYLRTAQRVLFRLGKFDAKNADALYSAARRIGWEDIIRPDGYVSVSSSVQNDTIRDSRFPNMRIKDAIVDRMRTKTGRRPDSGPEATGVVVFLHWRETACQLYLDTSGEPLSRRGYRRIPWSAPMQETLGASLLLASRWDRKSAFVNPMCGSGTLAIEAALMSLNSAPGLMRDNFGFMHVPDFDESLWDTLLDEAESIELEEPEAMIMATDISSGAVDASRKNARGAGVDQFIDFTVCDFRSTSVPSASHAGLSPVIMMNPEYGERLGETGELSEMYSGMGDFFKQQCQGYTGYVFTGNAGLAKKVGLRTASRQQFFNANIECRLLEYELYSGSRKASPHA